LLSIEANKTTKEDYTGRTTFHSILLCFLQLLILATTIIVRHALAIIVLTVDVPADGVQPISVDKFISAVQAHPHGQWALNGTIVRQVCAEHDRYEFVLIFFKVVLVGRVVGILRQIGRCTYLVVDGTSPPVQVRCWYECWGDVIDEVQ
jgi:hypothetical protein